MRLATYNVEWFANLFDNNNKLVVDDGWSGRQDVTRAQQIEALGIVFTAINADAVMIIEAPNTGRRQDTVEALENFAAAFDFKGGMLGGVFAGTVLFLALFRHRFWCRWFCPTGLILQMLGRMKTKTPFQEDSTFQP